MKAISHSYWTNDAGGSGEHCRLTWKRFGTGGGSGNEGYFEFWANHTGQLIKKLQIGGQGAYTTNDLALVVSGPCEFVAGDAQKLYSLGSPSAIEVLTLTAFRAFEANGDEGYIGLGIKQNNDVHAEFARIRWIGTDISSTSKDAAIAFSLQIANTMTEACRILGQALYVGTTTAITAGGTKAVVFGDNAGDPTLGASTAAIYAKTVSGVVELFARDSSNTSMQLSAHDASGRWVFRDERNGRRRQVDMERLIALVEQLTGESLWQEGW